MANFIISNLYNYSFYFLLITIFYENNIFIFDSLFLGLNHINAQEQSEISTKDTLIVGYNINAPFIYKKNDKLEGISYRMWKIITKEEKHIIY